MIDKPRTQARYPANREKEFEANNLFDLCVRDGRCRSALTDRAPPSSVRFNVLSILAVDFNLQAFNPLIL